MLDASPAPTRSPCAANEPTPASGCWREQLPSSPMPGADGGLEAEGEVQGDLRQQRRSAVKDPDGICLLQKLYSVWAQEQGCGEDEDSSTRRMLPRRFGFFPYTCHQVFIDLM